MFTEVLICSRTLKYPHDTFTQQMKAQRNGLPHPRSCCSQVAGHCLFLSLPGSTVLALSCCVICLSGLVSIAELPVDCVLSSYRTKLKEVIWSSQVGSQEKP